MSQLSQRTTQEHYGNRLLPKVLDDVAEANPNRLYAAVPRSNNLKDGFIDITFKDMARCVNFFASLLEKTLNCHTDLETVAYLGLPDLRNVVVLIAGLKLGYKVKLCHSFLFHIADY